MSTENAITLSAITVNLTTEQLKKVQALRANIDKLVVRYNNLATGVVVQKERKAIVLPAVGAEVVVITGRTTSTTQPVERVGTVLGIKPETKLESGKFAPAQIKVQIGTGFDAEIVTVYPGQIKAVASPELSAQLNAELTTPA